MRIAMIPTLFREVLTSNRFCREPDPDLVMDDANQVKGYVVIQKKYRFATMLNFIHLI